MVKTQELNPRSYKSIVAAMKSGRYRTRGQLLRAIVEAFRSPASAPPEPVQDVEEREEPEWLEDVEILEEQDETEGEVNELEL